MTSERPNGEGLEDEQVVANPDTDDQTAPGERELQTITPDEVGNLGTILGEESPGPEGVAKEENGAEPNEDSVGEESPPEEESPGPQDVALEENDAQSNEDSTEEEPEAEKEDEVAEEPEEEQSEIEVERAPTSVDEIDQECAVCGNTIPRHEEFIVAAYGPVHEEPCSHEGKSVWSETSPLEATD